MASPAAASSAARPQPSANAPTSSPAASSAPANKPRLPANGVAGKARPQKDTKSSSSPPRESNTPDKHAHDRLVFLAAHFVGCQAQVTLKTGERFSGIFSGAALEPSESQFVLKMAKSLPHESDVQTNGTADTTSEYLGYGEDHVLEFKFKDVSDLAVPNVSTDKSLARAPNGTTSSFKTDTDISGNRSFRERQLRPWDGAAEPSSDSTFDLAPNGSKSQTWNQFDANEALFGVKSNYDENHYTTSIDRSNPSYRERAAIADQIAKQIEGSITADAHVAEERGLMDEAGGDEDEEARYSGVRRENPVLPSSQGNRYTPPSKRAPTSHATVHGAPVDPAIISSQLARPDSASKTSKRTQSPLKTEDAPKPSTAKDDTAAESKDISKETSAGDVKKEPLPIPRPSVQIPGGSRPTPDATANVEHNVLDAFKHFAGSEKMKVQERQRQSQRKEKEVKINDLKKFAANFKLKTVVPTDMLGILAKDKEKQSLLIEKSQRQLDEQTSPPKTAVSGTPTEPNASRPTVSSRLDSSQSPAGTSNDRPNARANRSSQGPGTLQGNRGQTSMTSPRAPGGLGPRLLANQRNFTGQDTRTPPTGPAAISTEMALRGGSIQSAGPNFGARFNVQAMEFKPNPAASTFLPGTSPTPSSPATTKPTAPSRSGASESFFAGGRPKSPSQKKSLSEGFNPIVRMKKIVETDKKTKEFANNGGIPQAYRTPPTWDVAEANKEKTYNDMFEDHSVQTQSISPANGPMPHQHQLPPSLQGPHGIANVHPPPQASPHHFQNRGGDAHFDDHRMHPSSSQNSSVMPSPRFQPPMMPQPGQMYGPMQGPYGQPGNQYAMGQGGPIMYRPQYGNPQGMPMAPPMMQNASGGGNMMPVPMQQMPMYNPGQQPMFQPHPGSAQTPGPGGFPSPRPTHMMMHQGSHQGQPPQHMMYAAGGQPNQPVYMQQYPSQMGHMRGGAPMQQQHSYGNSPHMQHHFPNHRGGQYGGGNMGPQQMGPGSGMPHQGQPASRPMTHGGDHEEVK